MAIENSIVTIHRIPEITISSGMDWISVASFLITAVIVVVSARATIKGHEKTVSSQQETAFKHFLKSSRQGWINELRDTCSCFIAAALNVQRLNNVREGQSTHLTKLFSIDPAEHAKAISSWTGDHVAAIAELNRLKAKIQLLLNPQELDAENLMVAVNYVSDVCDQVGASARIPCDDVIRLCQVILKIEWDRAKSGE
ncbi:hypothetical protein [Stutzerimonas xanthomarina]|uniref:Uncharacterized protein n=2 Tax=Stutzerimonas xanthomarina TaxID=271420 RepID=A0A1M5MP78_9GAMM|nr:hypothetical protein [Stutzerimonas xanthomarina]MCP9337609.1 hypothetical protein [Stutzerimonas xanthomarina]SEH87558.1 hypothetical protein SAMN05216535_2408 [Stutzerimonas xanthomarina]SHG79224.1 hypothetical protein SAMN02744645_1409 [Stutzerimonas xanthomarina DSM 18231]